MQAFTALFLACSVALLTLAPDAPGVAQEPHAAGASSLSMSPDLLELYRQEMRQLLAGTQAIATAVPLADWDGIVATAGEMQASYVLERQLTPAQEEEIGALPERFLELDTSFHSRTGKLAAAARDRDAEAVAWQFSRLLETCAVCHAEFAQARFPAFRTGSGEAERHSPGGTK